MKTKFTGIKFVLLLIAAIPFGLQAQQSPDITGKWLGTLVINESTRLRLGFEITQNPDKSLNATTSSIDQDAFDIPVESVIFKNDSIVMHINTILADYRGLISDSTNIEGFLFQGGGGAVALDLRKVNEFPVVKPNRPQYPNKPYPYKEEEVRFNNLKASDVTIAGTLTLPDTTGSFPAVILITGSGPNDRDEFIFGHKVFLVLADYLTRAGFAVLRTDDRGVGSSTGDFNSADINDLASDAIASYEYLKNRKDIITAEIGILGHSLGAIIAPVVAGNEQSMAFVILMAGCGSTLCDGIIQQCEAIYGQMGISKEGISLNRQILETVFEIVKTEKNDSIAREQIRIRLKSFEPKLSQLSKDELTKLELSVPINPEPLFQFLSPVWRHDLFFDPRESLAKLKCPVLAMNGDKDMQASVQNLFEIEKVLKFGGNKNVTIKEFKGKNHLFQTTNTGAVDEYSKSEETISPEVLVYLVNWIKTTIN